MFPRVTNVRYLHDYWLELTFSDGTQVPLDFSDRIVGRSGIFTALQELDFFRRVSLDTEVGTLVWPNGVDFCPDVLYSEATGTPIQVKEPA